MNILAFGAHPDDIVLLCGGTLAKYASAGHKIFMAVVCRGDAVTTTLPPEEFGRLREEELRRSAAIINATVFPLGFPDFAIPSDYRVKLQIVEIIRRVTPEVIFTHDEEDYTMDHRRTAELLDDCFIMSRATGVKTESPSCSRHLMIYHMDTVGGGSFVPDVFVDITDFYHIKRKMMECHETEVLPYQGDPVVDTLEWMEVTARYRGIQAGVRYAEAFRWPRRWSRMEIQHLLP